MKKCNVICHYKCKIWGAPKIFPDPWANSTIVTKLNAKTVIYYEF